MRFAGLGNSMVEAGQAEFGAAISWTAAAAQASRAGNRDDIAGLAGRQAIPQGAGHIKRARQIDADDRVPIGIIGFQKGARRWNAGVVDQNVHLVTGGHDFGGRGLHLVDIGNIAGEGGRLAAGGFDFIGGAPQGLRLTGNQHHADAQ